MLVEFSSVVDAVRCAAEIQRAMLDRNAETSEDKRIVFRIGVNLGDVIADGGDIYGDGVNIAARLEALADRGGICISRTVRDHIGDRLPYTFDDIGEQNVKNIAQPVHAYALTAAAVASLPEVAIPLQTMGSSRHNSARLPVLVASIVAAIGIGIALWSVWPKGNSSAVPMASLATTAQRPPAIEAKCIATGTTGDVSRKGLTAAQGVVLDRPNHSDRTNSSKRCCSPGTSSASLAAATYANRLRIAWRGKPATRQ
jgi:hypothetical protein